MIRNAAALLVAAMMLASCDANDAQDAFRISAGAVPSGIFRTDDGITPLNGENDPDDWRTAPAYATSGFRVNLRAHPNPAGVGQSELVSFEVATTDRIAGGLRLVARDGLGGRIELTGFEEISGGGFKVFSFFASEILGAQPGDLWRLILFDTRGEPVTYGDILID